MSAVFTLGTVDQSAKTAKQVISDRFAGGFTPICLKA
jgi:hypothetical protein